MTLAERLRLITVGGWLSLLAATCGIDLHQRSAAAARLRTAASLARHAAHPKILAWCLENGAWQADTVGRYRRAIELTQAAQRIAPCIGSALIQATAQEGRAWARLGDGSETRASLAQVERLVARSPSPTGRSTTTDTTPPRATPTPPLRSHGRATRPPSRTRAVSSPA
ncbi:hypothetical protein [Actinomadura sp. 9N407]|uniref:hypothetical protein n=1 Tax=Actinomadura sp. 9N407 TaxID=3375154 RepID=UPI0037A81DE7